MKRDEIDVEQETVNGTFYQVLLSVVAFLTLIAVSRFITPVEFGLYVLLLSIGDIVRSFMYGFGEAVKKRASESDTHMDELASVSVGIVIASSLVALVGFVLVGVFTSWVTIEQSVAMWVFVVGSGMIMSSVTLLSGLGYPALAYRYRFIRNVLAMVCVVPLAYIGSSVAVLVIAAGVGRFIASLIVWYRIRPSAVLPSVETIQRVFKFARFSVPNKLLFAANERVPYFVLGALAAGELVGYYEIAWKTVLPALLFAFVVENILSVHISQAIERGESYVESVRQGLTASMALSIPLFVGSLIVGKPLIISVYSSDYAPASEALPVMALMVIMYSLVLVYQAVYRGKDSVHVVTRMTVGRVVGKVIGVPIGFMTGGLIGVVLSIAVVDGLVLFGYAVQTGMYPSIRLLVIQAVSASVMGGVLLGVTSVISFSNAFIVFGTVGLGGVIYFSLGLAGVYLFDKEALYRLKTVL